MTDSYQKIIELAKKHNAVILGENVIIFTPAELSSFVDNLKCRVRELEKAIAIYIREHDLPSNFESDADAIRYFCEKYND